MVEDKNNVATSSEERDRADGSPVTLAIDYDAAEDLIRDYVENFSSGEVLLDTSRPLEAGTRVRLVLSFPGLLEPITVSGVVRKDAGASLRDAQTSTLASKGTMVTLVADAERQALAERVEQVRKRDPRVVSRLIRILVVEDNPHVAQLIRNGLRGSGRRDYGDELAFNFRTVSNGRDALDMLRSEPFDVVIVDVYLPIMDGANLIEEVRTDDHLCQLPVIAVSAGGQAAHNAALRAGADLFLDKPMRLREIVDAMHKLVDFGKPGERS